MTHDQSFSITFPEARRYRIAAWLEKYAVFVFCPAACLLMVINNEPGAIYEQLGLVASTATIMAVATKYAMIVKRDLSRRLSEKLRNELHARTGLMMPADFPAVDEFRSLPLVASDGRVMDVSILRSGDEYVLSAVRTSTGSLPVVV